MAGIALRQTGQDGLDDAELAYLAAAGDDAAFAALFHRHFERLRRVCLLRGASDHDATDAAQQAFCHVWRHLKARREDGNVPAWLDAIVRNELRGIQRRTHPNETLEETLIAPGPQPDQIVQARAEIREILGDIRALPDGQRNALSLQLQGRLDDRSLAAVLGTQPATARRAVADARSSLTDMRNGRMMSCQSVRERIDDDRRTLRTREITAHLKACPGCETYARAGSRRRERQTLAVIPALIGRLARRARRLASRHLGGHSGLGVITLFSPLLITEIPQVDRA
jgi:RNA polymerase sigma factor (sigma-70 family)